MTNSADPDQLATKGCGFQHLPRDLANVNALKNIGTFWLKIASYIAAMVPTIYVLMQNNKKDPRYFATGTSCVWLWLKDTFFRFNSCKLQRKPDQPESTQRKWSYPQWNWKRGSDWIYCRLYLRWRIWDGGRTHSYLSREWTVVGK